MFNVFSVPRTTGWRRRKAEALRLETEKAKAQGLPPGCIPCTQIGRYSA